MLFHAVTRLLPVLLGEKSLISAWAELSTYSFCIVNLSFLFLLILILHENSNICADYCELVNRKLSSLNYVIQMLFLCIRRSCKETDMPSINNTGRQDKKTRMHRVLTMLEDKTVS